MSYKIRKSTIFTILFLLITINIPTIAVAAKTDAGCSLQFVSVPGSTTISKGDKVTYKYSLKNTGSSVCNGTSVSVYYAKNEKYINSDPVPTTSDYYWLIGRLMRGKSFSFSVTIQNVPGDNSQMFGEACASADNAGDACVKTPVIISDLNSVPIPALTPVPAPAPTPTPAPIQTGIMTQAWIYPGDPACNASKEYADGRVIDILKPEYYQVQSNGTLRQMTVSTDGCNGYSASNAADIKAHSVYQYATVSGEITNVRALLSSASLQSTAITTLTNFAVSSEFTGIELDWEGFSNWTTTDYSNYKNFVAALQNSLHSSGKKLMIDAPAISDAMYQGYFLFKYEDFTNIDYVSIMAYDYQYDFGVGEPVAPESWITNIVKWAKARLLLSKIVIGIPAYGYHGTLGSYIMTIDTYAQSSAFPGFSTRKINSEGEEVWMSGNTYYSAQPQSVLDRKKALLESLGIKNISVWHLGGNNWFTGN